MSIQASLADLYTRRLADSKSRRRSTRLFTTTKKKEKEIMSQRFRIILSRHKSNVRATWPHDSNTGLSLKSYKVMNHYYSKFTRIWITSCKNKIIFFKTQISLSFSATITKHRLLQLIKPESLMQSSQLSNNLWIVLCLLNIGLGGLGLTCSPRNPRFAC